MDNQRLLLYGALGLLLLLVWQAWQVDYGRRPDANPPAQAEQSQAEATPPDDAPDAPLETGESQAASPEGEGGGGGTGVDAAPGPTLASGERIHVVTDLLKVTIDTHGGDLRETFLRRYKAKSGGEEPVELLTDSGGELFVAQSGLQAGDRPAPNHRADYSAERTEYRLAEGQDSVTVPLTWERDGIRVTKTYTFHRDQYAIDVAFRVDNASGEPWVGRQYRQFQRSKVPADEQPTLQRAFFGAAYYNNEEKYEQLAFSDIADEPIKKTFEGGWAAMVEHYFLAAWIPEPEQSNTYWTRRLGSDADPRYLIGLYTPAREVAAGDSAEFATRVYLGPKEVDYLSGVAKGLTLTIDYGYLAFLSEPLFWFLDHIHSVVGNWGVAIVLLTLLIKILFYKLSEKSYRSMARMRKFQPKIQQLKERYGDDRERMGRAMMDLYKKEKINPLGGCLPILVQIPVFIALYWMLLGTVELRHADFMLWINDLSARDPLFILPVLMGLSMWGQQKLNPAPVDPMQQKIFSALPFVFTIFFSFFPAGLVLYWLTNNVLSIAQQYYITRYVVGTAPSKPGGPPAKASKAGGSGKAVEDQSGDAEFADSDPGDDKGGGKQ